MKIAFDVMGGDYCPQESVKGAILALKKHKDLELVLVGDEEKIKEIIEKNNYDGARLEIVNALDVITCNESPVEAFRTKPESSLVKTFDLARANNEISAIISSGSTGALFTAAVTKVRRIEGVKQRPALAPLLPTIRGGKVMLLDSGANVDATAENLVQYALLGHAYMKSVEKIDNPRIALLNIGVEEKKGEKLTIETYQLLKQRKDIHFVGNVEARDVLSGDYDVVVCDAFAGNVLIKTLEGTVSIVNSQIKEGIKKNPLRMLGYLLSRGAYKELKRNFSTKNVGGAVFLGVQKVIVKAHGNSKAENFVTAIEQTIELVSKNLVENVREIINNSGEEND